jgi:hypothetical protein
MELSPRLTRVIESILRVWSAPLFGISIDKGKVSLAFLGIESPTESIDQRLARLEVAKLNLQEAIGAVDELKHEAEANKRELQSALAQLQTIGDQRQAAEKELSQLKLIASADVATFQKVAGVPSRRQIAREHFVGFLLGVLASVMASGIWWLFAHFIPALKS